MKVRKPGGNHGSKVSVYPCTLITDTINENVKRSDYWYYKWRSYAYSLLIH